MESSELRTHLINIQRQIEQNRQIVTEIYKIITEEEPEEEIKMKKKGD